MSVILSLLGILVAAAGVAAIGFGIPINEFTLGTTLIVAGVSALTGGLVLLGLAAVVAELGRLRETISTRLVIRPIVVPASRRSWRSQPRLPPSSPLQHQRPVPVLFKRTRHSRSRKRRRSLRSTPAWRLARHLPSYRQQSDSHRARHGRSKPRLRSLLMRRRLRSLLMPARIFRRISRAHSKLRHPNRRIRRKIVRAALPSRL